MTINNTQIQPGKFRHYKGNLYEVLFIAKHSESLEDMVVYRPLYENSVSPFWVRPLSMFLEKVEFQGKNVLRFERI